MSKNQLLIKTIKFLNHKTLTDKINIYIILLKNIKFFLRYHSTLINSVTYFLILRYFKMFYCFSFIFRLIDIFSAPFKFYSRIRRLLKFKKPLICSFYSYSVCNIRKIIVFIFLISCVSLHNVCARIA